MSEMDQPPPDVTKIATVRPLLLAWFRSNRRDLPWRQTRDPYRILVAEVMLQQTQVDRVIAAYHAWLERFPTVQALAGAPTADVIRAWAGLGYNRRAINLQRTAQAVTAERGGEFPREVVELRALPGIGPYTAGAIACFAFEQDVAFVDTNMRRVLHRLVFGADVPAPTASERAILAVAAAAVPPGDGWEWNQGLIEFGALRCTARKPACVVCPLQASCRAYPTLQSALAMASRGPRRPREGQFAGSNRYFRGRVLDALRAMPIADGTNPAGLGLRDLGARVRPGFTDDDLPWLRNLVGELSRDGLARVTLAEETPAYEVGDRAADEMRVALP